MSTSQFQACTDLDTFLKLLDQVAQHRREPGLRDAIYDCLFALPDLDAAERQLTAKQCMASRDACLQVVLACLLRDLRAHV